ncbi:MAG: hypothetical protein JSR99_09670 [Proteobacteria bacterium]|nr:hypothetical protein [Pseudomonadota bacterium]
MKISTSITGIGSSARDRAALLVQQMLAKREVEPNAVGARGSSKVSAATTQVQGGK